MDSMVNMGDRCMLGYHSCRLNFKHFSGSVVTCEGELDLFSVSLWTTGTVEADVATARRSI